MATKPGVWYDFPWARVGSLKYAVMVPFVVAAVTGRDDADNFCWHLCAIAALRYVNAQVWISLSRVHALTRGTRIQAKGIDFKQVDREDHWDDYILLQTLVMAAVAVLFVVFAAFGLGDRGACDGGCAGCGRECANRREGGAM